MLALIVSCVLLAQAPPPLLQVKRIHVDKLTGGEAAAQMRDMLIASLQATRLFVVTENPDRADAFLRGAAEDLIYTERREASDGINGRASLGIGRDRATASGGSRGSSTGVAIGQNESFRTEERRHEAMATLRLVDKNGDVIWSTTKESGGAKFRGAAVDTIDKVTRQLVSDIELARRPPSAQKAP